MLNVRRMKLINSYPPIGVFPGDEWSINSVGDRKVILVESFESDKVYINGEQSDRETMDELKRAGRNRATAWGAVPLSLGVAGATAAALGIDNGLVAGAVAVGSLALAGLGLVAAAGSGFASAVTQYSPSVIVGNVQVPSNG